VLTINFIGLSIILRNNARTARPLRVTIFKRRNLIMKIRPLHDRLIVRRWDEEKTSTGGIIIPDSATEKPAKGEVVSVGNGKILENGEVRALDVKAGDKILFGKYSGTEVKVDDEELLVMREDDVMAVFEG
jgi:chaperonin GroES